jgi:hypothetical protein
VDVCKTRESFDGVGEALSEGFSSVFDLSRVEGSDSANLEARADLKKGSNVSLCVSHARSVLEAIYLRRKSPLRSRQNNVQKLLTRRHCRYVLPLSLHVDGVLSLLLWRAAKLREAYR